MKVLMVDKYYFIKGGAERYLFELSKILQMYGHQIIPFSMKHENNFHTPFEKFFVENIEFKFNSFGQKIVNSARIISRIFYSIHSKNRIEKLINQVKPDMAHLHMIDHQLSPSILHVLKKYDIPVLQTVHQYKLICPNYRLYIEHRNEICERCLKGNYFQAIVQKCHKHSLFASALVCLETYLHKWLKIYEMCVNLFHAPSQFLGQKLIEGGIDSGKVKQLFYTIDISQYPYTPEFKDYFVYFGRLSGEKGILTLLKAMNYVSGHSANLWIVGEGPEKEKLVRFATEHRLNRVQFLGLKEGKELKSIVANAMFVVVPSEWYENSPLVIYEAFALGKPVIGSNLGGIPELIDADHNGLLFEAGNAKDLAEKIDYFLHHPATIKEFGKCARQKAEACFSPESHYQKMNEFYQSIQNNRVAV